MELPKGSSKVPIRFLSAAFVDRATSYKFHWLLSILEILRKRNTRNILIEDLAIEMVVFAWFPLTHFRLSFGVQDQLAAKIEAMNALFGPVDAFDSNELRMLIRKHKANPLVASTLDAIVRYVPYRFISPWFTNELRGIPDGKKNELLLHLSNTRFNTPASTLYRLISKREIELSIDWYFYLHEHLTILTGFVYWELSRYLEKNNPNVPNITEKLIPPSARDLTNARFYWNTYLSLVPECTCIYSAAPLTNTTLSLDHFLPWTFVGHDQIWNIIPTIRSVNSSKGDKLPALQYFTPFAKLQADALRKLHQHNSSKVNKMAEDYCTLFKSSLAEIVQASDESFEMKLVDNLRPMIQIAKNMGFPSEWQY